MGFKKEQATESEIAIASSVIDSLPKYRDSNSFATRLALIEALKKKGLQVNLENGQAILKSGQSGVPTSASYLQAFRQLFADPAYAKYDMAANIAILESYLEENALSAAPGRLKAFIEENKSSFSVNRAETARLNELNQTVQTAKQGAQEIIRLIADIMAPFKVTPGYAPKPGFITQRDYDAKEAKWTELGQTDLNALRAEHARLMEARRLKAAPRQEKRQDDISDVSRYKPKSVEQAPTFNRYPTMPKVFWFPGEPTSRVLDGDLLVALQRNDFNGWWRVFIDRWGYDQVNQRIQEFKESI